MRVSKVATLVLGVIAIALGILFEKQNVAFMVGLAFGIAAAANFPVLILSMYWRGLTTRGALVGGYGGLVSAVPLVLFSKSVWVSGPREPGGDLPLRPAGAVRDADRVPRDDRRLEARPPSVSAQAERRAFEDQYVRAQTGVGAPRPWSTEVHFERSDRALPPPRGSARRREGGERRSLMCHERSGYAASRSARPSSHVTRVRARSNGSWCMSETRRKVTIWAFSVSRLKHVFESVAPLYADAADIRVFDRSFEDAVQAAQELIRSGEQVDAIIAAGANGAYLQDHNDIPVVLVTPTASDILHALADAQRFSRRMAVLNFRTPGPGARSVHRPHGLEVEQRVYVTLEDAEASLLDLSARGFEVVVGPGPVCDIAQGGRPAGRPAPLPGSASDAIDRALYLARLTRAERAKRERLAAVLDHIEPAVVAVGMDERIHSANRAVERLLGVSPAAVIGRAVRGRAGPEPVARARERGRGAGGGPQDRRPDPGREPGPASRARRARRRGAHVPGSGAIQRVDRSLRSEHRPRRFVARTILSGIVGGSPAISGVKGARGGLRPDGRDGAHHGRERHRQGAARAGSTTRAGAATIRSSRSTAPRSGRRSSRPSSSATRKARSPARSAGGGRGSSRRRTPGPSSSTRSATSRSRSRAACCACCRSGRSCASAATTPSRSTYA